MRYAVLLRGVNVGGRSQLAMSDLRGALEEAGFDEVSTYLQSGNAVVAAPGRAAPATVADRVRAALTGVLGASPGVVVRTGRDLAALVAANPYPDAVGEPKFLNVAFLSEQPDPKAMLDPSALAPDEYAFGDRCVYLHYVGTSPGRSRLAEIVCREALRAHSGAIATVRNWNTVLAMAERTAG